MRVLANLALVCFALLATSCTAPEQVMLKARTLEEAKSLAADSGGLIVLDFWRDG